MASMDDPALRTITKRDAPPISRPTAVWIVSVMFATGYVLLMVCVPDVRPGIIECVVALVLGAIGGWFNTRWLPQFLTDLAVYSRSEPWLDWAPFFMSALPFESSRARQTAFPVVFFGGFIVIIGVFSLLSGTLEHLRWPWVHPGARQVLESFPSAMLLYWMLLFAIDIRATRRWYNSLPD